MENITNEKVLEFLNVNGVNKCVEFLQENNPNRSDIKPSKTSFEYSLKKLKSQVKAYKKSISRLDVKSEYESFLKSQFCFPVPNIERRHSHVIADNSLDLNRSFTLEKDKVHDLNKKLKETEQSNEQTQAELQETQANLKQCKLNLKRTASRETYALKKIQKLEEKQSKDGCCAEKDGQIEYLQDQIKKKDQEIFELKQSCEYLQDVVNDNIIASKTLDVFDEERKQYTESFKECVYELLQYNVSASKVSDVVKCVLHMLNMKPNKLPSKATVLRMNLQRLFIAQSHLTEVFSKEDNTTLLTDETSKLGSKYMGFEAADSDGNLWVLGLRDIETKSADNTLKVFKEILSDLDEKSSQTDNQVSKDIICHITATMSDRAATEIKFNQLLEQYRKEILPLTYYNYDTFTDEEKSSLESLSNFFCGLHAIVNFAETTNKCVKEIEIELLKNKELPSTNIIKQDSEPGTCRLIRTAAKAFGIGNSADEKSGCQMNFKTYVTDFLKENNLHSVPLRAYRGSRFNVLFSNANGVYFMHEHMIAFLQSFGAENRLLKAVLEDLSTREYIAGLKALGLVSQFITSPLWSVLEDKSVSITDMNTKYLELTTFLEDAAINIDKFMTGELYLFQDKVRKDKLYEKIILPTEFDNIVQAFLEVIIPALCQLSKKLFMDHLPGGKHVSLTNENKQKLKGVPKTSCFAESVFGQLDHLIRTKPNMSTLAAEACIMFLNNKTLDWLKAKTDAEKVILIKSASQQVNTLKTKFKERLYDIEQKRRIAIQEKIARKEIAEREKIRKQELSTNEILRHGLWQSEAEVDNMLSSYESTAERIKALKVQLKFRKEVLLQVPEDKKSFNLTKAVDGKKSRKSLSDEELAKNLKTLVRQAIVKDAESNEQKHMLVGKRVRHRFTEKIGTTTAVKWYTGKVISQVPWFPNWFNIVYDNDESVYTYHHLDNDLAESDLEIIV